MYPVISSGIGSPAERLCDTTKIVRPSLISGCYNPDRMYWYQLGEDQAA